LKTLEDAEADIIYVINERQEITYNELRSFAATEGISEDTLKKGLVELEKASAIASRSSGGIPTYYVLQDRPSLRKILIVEDDKNINNLMAISIGKGFDVEQIYDGGEAIRKIKQIKPDLVVLDLMLPGADGLEICQTVKKDSQMSNTVVIIVSAMDATSNRFKGIKYGADYYIKKPFDPGELRSLVTIFLKKKGKKFDPLIDLPNEEKISDAVEKALSNTNSSYEIGRLRVEGLAGFAGKFGMKSGVTILRLASQLLQDKVKETGSNIFVGFLNSEDFVIAGDKSGVGKVANTIKVEFSAVLPFIYQSEGYKPIELGIEDTYGAEKPKLKLSYTQIKRDFLIERRAEVLKGKEREEGKDIGSYTYEELRHMLGSDDLDITITRDPNGIRLSVGKSGKRKEGKDEEIGVL
jgi:CheY-like chemotaxis protein